MNKIYKIFKTYVDVSDIKVIDSEVHFEVKRDSNTDYIINIDKEKYVIFSTDQSEYGEEYEKILGVIERYSRKRFFLRTELTVSENEIVDMGEKRLKIIRDNILTNVNKEVEKLINYWKAYIEQDSSGYVIWSLEYPRRDL